MTKLLLLALILAHVVHALERCRCDLYCAKLVRQLEASRSSESNLVHYMRSRNLEGRDLMDRRDLQFSVDPSAALEALQEGLADAREGIDVIRQRIVNLSNSVVEETALLGERVVNTSIEIREDIGDNVRNVTNQVKNGASTVGSYVLIFIGGLFAGITVIALIYAYCNGAICSPNAKCCRRGQNLGKV